MVCLGTRNPKAKLGVWSGGCPEERAAVLGRTGLVGISPGFEGGIMWFLLLGFPHLQQHLVQRAGRRPVSSALGNGAQGGGSPHLQRLLGPEILEARASRNSQRCRTGLGWT